MLSNCCCFCWLRSFWSCHRDRLMMQNLRLISNLMNFIMFCGSILRNVVQDLWGVNWSVLGGNSKVRSINSINRIVESFSFLKNSLSSINLILNFINGRRINWLEHLYNSIVLDLFLSSIPMVSYNVLNVIKHSWMHFLMQKSCIHKHLSLCSRVN